MKRLATWGLLLALVTANAAYADDSEVKCVMTSPAPVVTANPFNRTQTLDDLYIASFGTLQKYQLQGDEIVAGSGWRSIHVDAGSVHSQPAKVIYGGKPNEQDVDDAVLYALANDGSLDAIDAKTGIERWRYVLQEHEGLDGTIRVLKYDTNDDGIVDPGDSDRVILFFGQGRAGSRYYAVDVTYRKPRVLWTIGPSTPGLAGIGQAWSTPTIARVRVSGVAQNSQRIVLIFGGGYDTAEDSAIYQPADARGNAIYMVDALRGTVLWSARTSDASLVLKRMTHAIPSDVAVLDLDGDGYTDRMYVGDMAAQLWRFDIFNGKAPAELVTGGVIASLGTREDTTHTKAATRRFYNAPDVAAIRKKGFPPFLNIAIGSGDVGRSPDTAQDRFYSIRDYKPFSALSQEQYDDSNHRIVQDKDLTDVSANVGAGATPVVAKSVPADEPGWKILLNAPRSSWVGEKVLATAVTFDGRILFPSYTPGNGESDECSAGMGTNRIYALNAFDGSGHYSRLAQRGIAPPVVFLFPAQNRSGASDRVQGPRSPRVICLAGIEVLGVCKSFNPLVKTYWRESDAK